MPLKRPYYALHQIDTGKYTSGGEFYKQVEGGGTVEYVGPYHVLPNRQTYSGFTPSQSSVELFRLSELVDPSQLGPYGTLTKVKTGKYISPKYTRPTITDENRTNGFIKRYFVQQKNTPSTTIVEIDIDQYNSGRLWRKISLNWIISGEIQAVENVNKLTVFRLNLSFPGLDTYITNYTEFFS
jgi:hypothetical protein